MFNLNFLGASYWGYIINYFPVFNIITAAIQLITLKNNILQAVGSCSRKVFNSLNTNNTKGGVMGLFINLLLTSVVCIPAIVICLTLRNIQQVMKYITSIFGFLLMLVIPYFLILAFRKKFQKSNNIEGNLNKAFLRHSYQVYILFGVASGIFALIVFGFFNNNVNTCVISQ
jgi:hypothetical protein